MSSDTVKDVKKAAELMQEANRILGGGPLHYYLEQMAGFADYCTERFSPFKKGDVVLLRKAPTINEKDSWGWMPYKEVLVAGAKGIVTEIETGPEGFRYLVQIPIGSRHHFTFREASLCTEKEWNENHVKEEEPEYIGVEGFIPELKATVRECIDCGCLTPGGPTRCKRCANLLRKED